MTNKNNALKRKEAVKMTNNDSKKIIYIENTSNDPHYNLAFEEYVFNEIAKDNGENEGVPILLLWQNEPSVIIGRYQNTIEEINYDYISEHNVNVVRRNTGGGAVYHDLGNLNYSFIIPDVETKIDFKTFTLPIINALRSQGIPVEQTGRNDIVVEGKKFSGNAQQFLRKRLLHHGTIMYDVDTEAVAAALNVKAGKFRSKATKSVKSRVTNLKPYFDAKSEGGSRIENVDDFKQLLIQWFMKEYEFKEMKLTDEQLNDIRKLKESKYDTHEWTFEKSPEADVIRGDYFRCGYVEFHFVIRQHVISSVKLVGDFFASRDIGELEDMLEGYEYTPEVLLDVLGSADLTSFLGDVTAEELVGVIV